MPHREQKLSKAHDIAVNRLKDWQRKFTATLTDTMKMVNDFKQKDRMSEAESYLLMLQDTTRKLEDFTREVRPLVRSSSTEHFLFQFCRKPVSTLKRIY